MTPWGRGVGVGVQSQKLEIWYLLMHCSNFRCLSPILFAQSDFQKMTPWGRGGRAGGTVTKIAMARHFIHISVLCKFQLATYSSFCTKGFSRYDPLGQRGWGWGYSHKHWDCQRSYTHKCTLQISCVYLQYFWHKVIFKKWPPGAEGVRVVVQSRKLQ